jgi:hypothetical protein
MNFDSEDQIFTGESRPAKLPRYNLREAVQRTTGNTVNFTSQVD